MFSFHLCSMSYGCLPILGHSYYAQLQRQASATHCLTAFSGLEECLYGLHTGSTRSSKTFRFKVNFNQRLEIGGKLPAFEPFI